MLLISTNISFIADQYVRDLWTLAFEFSCTYVASFVGRDITETFPEMFPEARKPALA